MDQDITGLLAELSPEEANHYRWAFALLFESWRRIRVRDVDFWRLVGPLRRLEQAGADPHEISRGIDTDQNAKDHQADEGAHWQWLDQMCPGAACFAWTAEVTRADAELVIPDMPLVATPDMPLALPEWDAKCRELYCDGRLVKRYRGRADNQTLILDAFQELNWQRHIDDPLPPRHGVDEQSRLRDAIRGLNRYQEYPALLFVMDGTGQGILWRRQTQAEIVKILADAPTVHPKRTPSAPRRRKG